MSLPKTRKEAKAQGSKLYNTGKPCKWGHYADRSISGGCVECARWHTRAWQAKNRDHVREYNAAYHAENRESALVRHRKWRDENREHRAAYKKANKGSVNADTAKRHAAKLQRTPKWLTADDHAQIKAVYEQAQRLTDCFGIQFHVDHIHPLQGKNVSGLHVPWNLRVVTATANIRKGNSFG